MEYETRSKESLWAGLLGGLVLGALAMYIADPSQGRRRRALLEDKFSSIRHQSSHALSNKLRDTRNRWSGLQAGVSQLLSRRDAKPIDDHVLAARVRSRLGRSLPNLHQIEVTAQAGTVTLAGPVNAEEMSRLVHLAKAIPGVESVQHRLLEHSSQKPFRSAGAGLLQGRSLLWLAGALGLYSLSRRSPMSLAAVTSLGLLARAWNKAERNHRQLAFPLTMQEVEQMIDINAAPETVFDVWSNFENFPHFMSHVVEVRDLGQQRSHWVISGPDGMPLACDAVLTESERPRRQAWRTEHGNGSIQLQAIEGGTRTTVRMAWQPTAGEPNVFAHSDLGQMMADGLQRLKQFIESGLPVRESAAAGKERGPLFH